MNKPEKNLPIKVLMVCLGNICRSPTAEAVFRQKVSESNLLDQIEIDSAGTGDWHLGHAPDSRATAAAAKRNFDLSPLRARLVVPADFEKFDYIFAMDKENHKNLLAMSPAGLEHKLSLFLTYPDNEKQQGYDEVPDPYYSGDEGFELVLDLTEGASSNIIASMVSNHALDKK